MLIGAKEPLARGRVLFRSCCRVVVVGGRLSLERYFLEGGRKSERVEEFLFGYFG